MECGRDNNCRLEVPRYNTVPYEQKCSCGSDEGKCGNNCDNPIRVLSNNVLWNGCDLRYLNVKPGDSLENCLIEADRKMERMERKFLELLDAYNELNSKFVRYEQSK